MSLPHGSADRNVSPPALRLPRNRSLPHGSADRNVFAGGKPVIDRVAPSRERGSKREEHGDDPGGGGRSLTGARIETPTARIWTSRWGGRSLTGARIETWRRAATGRRSRVAPSRERGSKREISIGLATTYRRSLTGARIETHCMDGTAGPRGSLPHGSADRNVEWLQHGRAR